MVISIEEEQKNSEYQEIINVDVENIANNNKNWRPIYEVIDDSFFAATKIFPTEFLDQCKNNPNEPQNIPYEVKVALKKWLWKKVYMQNWL